MDSGKRTFYLGRYNCIEQLGTGPVGETYRAKIYGVAGFEKQFAVKRLYTQLSEDEAFVARFVQAASAFASLEHQRIARVHEVNAQGAHYYIVVDLVRGLDLRRLLDLLQQRGEALAPDAAMTIAIDVAEALEYAHGKTNVLPGGVLHLGLTAPSVMVTYEGDIKLVDVGLLAALTRPGWSDDDTLTATLAYLSPEQWRGENVDARADVFSLGVVLHELLGGARVFLSDRAAELRQTIESGPPAPPSADPRLQEIVTRALQPDRERRFASIAEMRAAIQAILGGRIDRARADLSALVRRLAAPRERRTGAFAAVTLLPAATGLTSPVAAAKPPPIPPQAHAWSPPTPRPPVGAVLSTIPVHNTLAGIGPDDQALVPIELIELPGLPTERGMPTVMSEDAETSRVPRAGDERISPPPPPPPPVIIEADAASERSADSTHSESDSSATTEGSAGATSAGANGGTTPPESSWSPPSLPPRPPSPEPLFAEPAVERREPVEPPKSTVPGVKLPPRRAGANAVLGGVGLVAVVGALAIYAGLSGNGATQVSAGSAANQSATTTASEGAEDHARVGVAPQDPAATAPSGSTPATVTPNAQAHGAEATNAATPTATTQNPHAQNAVTSTAPVHAQNAGPASAPVPNALTQNSHAQNAGTPSAPTPNAPTSSGPMSNGNAQNAGTPGVHAQSSAAQNSGTPGPSITGAHAQNSATPGASTAAAHAQNSATPSASMTGAHAQNSATPGASTAAAHAQNSATPGASMAGASHAQNSATPGASTADAHAQNSATPSASTAGAHGQNSGAPGASMTGAHAQNSGTPGASVADAHAQNSGASGPSTPNGLTQSSHAQSAGASSAPVAGTSMPNAHAPNVGAQTQSAGAQGVPAGAFAIESTPEGAAVFVDGEPQGTTPAQIVVAPGSHKLIVAGEGQLLVKRAVDIVPGGRLELPLEAAKLPSPIAGSAGLKVRCKSHGEIRIFVDGADSGRNCPNDERISVAPGTHKIGLFSARTGETHEVEHEVTEGNNSTRVYVRY